MTVIRDNMSGVVIRDIRSSVVNTITGVGVIMDTITGVVVIMDTIIGVVLIMNTVTGTKTLYQGQHDWCSDDQGQDH